MAEHSPEYTKMVNALKKQGLSHAHADEIVRMGHRKAFYARHKNVIDSVAKTAFMRSLKPKGRRKK